jgi:hypothetical protein
VFAGAGETGESWASGMAVQWGTTKVNKLGFLLIGKSGKRLENCERAESEEEKMGEQGRGKMLAWRGDLTRDRRGKK